VQENPLSEVFKWSCLNDGYGIQMLFSCVCDGRFRVRRVGIFLKGQRSRLCACIVCDGPLYVVFGGGLASALVSICPTSIMRSSGVIPIGSGISLFVTPMIGSGVVVVPQTPEQSAVGFTMRSVSLVRFD
jgi:hypothetical protein